MSTIALYECNILRSKNKVGKLKTDENGYREICLGAFDCMTEKGEFYPFTQAVKNMFKPGSRLLQQIETGRLRGEIEHPYPTPGMTFPQYLNRVKMVHNQFTAHHIKSVRLETTKDHRGNNVVSVIGMVKGSGPYGDQLDKKFENPDENIDFSVRTLTTPTAPVNGVTQKLINLLVTWDQVNQGGVAIANRYDTPSMESADNGVIWTPELAHRFEITPATLAASDLCQPEGIGMESDELIDSTLIRTSLGWEKVQLVSPRSSLNW